MNLGAGNCGRPEGGPPACGPDQCAELVRQNGVGAQDAVFMRDDGPGYAVEVNPLAMAAIPIAQPT